MSKKNCVCISEKQFDACCGRFLNGDEMAGSAEELMRSRYAAFVLKDVDYLVTTHHPSKRKLNERDQLLETINQTRWLGLKIVAAGSIEGTDNRAFVEFVAFYEAESVGQLHEKSRFVFEQGQWFYVDGVTLPAIQFRRNEPCWCGSGKKFKRCHG